MRFAQLFLSAVRDSLLALNLEDIALLAQQLRQTRDCGGRVFVVGSGGGAGHASHMVADLRKLCDIEAYAPYDNVSELTARANDDGWDTSVVAWLRGSRIRKGDCLFVLSVGGGSVEHGVSLNLVRAVDCAVSVGATVLGIVGRDGGYVKRRGAPVVVPVETPAWTTPIVEGVQAIVWHLLVTHPLLKIQPTKWEEVVATQVTVTKSDTEETK